MTRETCAYQRDLLAFSTTLFRRHALIYYIMRRSTFPTPKVTLTFVLVNQVDSRIVHRNYETISRRRGGNVQKQVLVSVT